MLGVLARRVAQVLDHLVDVLGQLADLAARLDLDRSREIALGHRRRHFADRANLRGQLRGKLIDAVGEPPPEAGGAGNLGLTAELSFEADLARDRRHLVGERRQRVDHAVDRLGKLRDLAGRLQRQLALEVAVGDAGDDLRDAANLRRKVRGHEVDGVGEVFPRPADAGNARLTAELSFGSDLARDARDFRSKRVELIDHRVDRVFELENLALDVNGDLLREVAVGDGGRHFRDVANLRGEVRGHPIDRVGKVLPRSGDAAHLRLTAEPSLRADFARDARDLGGKSVELVDHRVDRVFELENFAAYVDGNLLREIAVGDGRRDLGDVTHLRGEVRGHEVHRIGKVFPRAADAFDHRLPAEPPFRADLARDARDFRGKAVELVDHRVDRIFELENLAANVDGDLSRKIAVGDGRRNVGDVAHLRGEVREP